MSEVVETLMAAGAEIVRASIPTAGWIGGPGTVMAVLNRNPESTAKHDPAHCSIVFVYEIKRDLNAYLSEWASETPIRTMADVIAFNECAAEVLPPSSIARLSACALAGMTSAVIPAVTSHAAPHARPAGSHAVKLMANVESPRRPTITDCRRVAGCPRTERQLPAGIPSPGCRSLAVEPKLRRRV